MTEIPLDLMVEILIRLPGKYLARQRKRRPHLYMCLVDKDGQSALLSMSSTSPDNTCFVVDQDLSIPGMGGYYLNDLDGLMCFSVGKKACIYNPSTGQRLTLPKINADIIADQGQTRYINRYYIGYDPVNDQNKLLCTSVMYSYRLSNLKSEHWVFMLEAGGSWKKAVSHENYRPHAPFARGQSISGSVVHYLAWHDMYTCVIVSFDVRSEELTTIIAPEGVRDDMPIPALEMKAELIDYDAEKKEWSKRSLVLQPCQRHLVQDTEFIVKGTTQDGKVILAPVDMHSGFYILCYDLQSNGLSKVEINGVPHRWFDKECYYDLRLMSENLKTGESQKEVDLAQFLLEDIMRGQRAFVWSHSDNDDLVKELPRRSTQKIHQKNIADRFNASMLRSMSTPPEDLGAEFLRIPKSHKIVFLGLEFGSRVSRNDYVPSYGSLILGFIAS
ncbi:hypothetical protein Bca101_017949 [Brassica carinata]